MPSVKLTILEGYGPDDKQRLGTALTGAVRQVIPANPDLVTVTIEELGIQDYYRGGKTRRPAAARPDPADIVKGFLAALEDRDLDRAQSFLSDGAIMTFPATAPMSGLDEVIAWARPRYKSVSKTFEGFDVVMGVGDEVIVYCRGTLQGLNHDGTMFEGVRFIDRFEVTHDKISKQDVWNDMGETRMLG